MNKFAILARLHDKRWAFFEDVVVYYHGFLDEDSKFVLWNYSGSGSPIRTVVLAEERSDKYIHLDSYRGGKFLKLTQYQARVNLGEETLIRKS